MKLVRYISFIIPFLFCSICVIAQSGPDYGIKVHADARLNVLLKKNRHPKPQPSAAAAAATVVQQPNVVAIPRAYKKSIVVYSGKGYRVQIYNGPDRSKALAIKMEFMRHFPGIRTYLSYVSPSFRVKVGDYRNRAQAAGMMKEANSMYSPCMIVPDIITVSTY